MIDGLGWQDLRCSRIVDDQDQLLDMDQVGILIFSFLDVFVNSEIKNEMNEWEKPPEQKRPR